MLALQAADRIEYRVVKKPETMELRCPECEKPMTKTTVSGKRHLVSFNGVYCLRFEYYGCVDPSCPFEQTVKIPDGDILPETSFGPDVLQFIQRERWKYKQSLDQILERLTDDKDLLISRAEVDVLMNLGEKVLKEQAVKEARKEIEENGLIILSIDGMGTETGYDQIYVLRDVISGRTLLAEYCTVATAETIRELIRKVVTLYGVPVEGVISDHAENIINAVKDELSGIPHQFCRFHFLRNVAAPMKELDHEGAKKIRNDVGKISTIRTLEKKRKNSRAPSTGRRSERFSNRPRI